jgi:hypothetical protein
MSALWSAFINSSRIFALRQNDPMYIGFHRLRAAAHKL